MPVRLLLAAAAVTLAGCGGARVFETPDPLESPTAFLVFDLPDEYEAIDIRYDTGVSGEDVYRRSTVQVFARHRETGAQALLIYDPRRRRQPPTTVIELQRLPPADR